MDNLKRIELACLYISHRLALLDYTDLRNSNCERSESLRKPLRQIGFNIDNRFVKYFLNKQSKLDLTWIDKIFKKHRTDIKHIFGKYLYHPVNVTCCGSCHTGTSATTKQEIEVQRNRFDGVFICKDCENNALNIDKIADNYLFTGSGFYKNEGIRSKGTKYLGFGGSKIIMKKTNGDIVLTNNLFHITSLHKCFYEKIKHKINCELIWINTFKDEELKKHLTELEIKSIATHIKRCEELGHKI